MSSPEPGTRRRSTDIVSLAERMGHLQALRAGFVAVVVVTAIVAPGMLSVALPDILFFSAAYLLLAAGTELVRKSWRGRGLGFVATMLLVDGLFLAWTVYASGGTNSPLRFLAYLHLIAVSLLASYRTGLKIAIWHSLLFFVVFYAQAAGLVDRTDTFTGTADRGEFYRLATLNVFAFWLTALATASFSAINERELRRRRADLEALSVMTAQLETKSDPKDIAATVLADLTRSFGFNRGALLAGQHGEPELLAYVGPGDPVDLGAAPGAVDTTIAEAWKQRRTLLVRSFDADGDARLNALLPMARNVVVIPLFAEGQPLGALVLEHPSTRGDRIERRAVAMAEQFAAHAGLSLNNAWLLTRVQKMAETDPLTGLPNRRVFEFVLEREISRAVRNGEQVTLVMLDIDHFKLLNDAHGHQVGDRVLRDVGRALTAACRDFDTPARFGGEEFAVILPSCNAKESLIAAERLRAAIATSDAPLPVTASAGTATFPRHASEPEGLVHAADEAMYESKRAGRNRVTRSRRTAKKRPAVVARQTDE